MDLAQTRYRMSVNLGVSMRAQVSMVSIPLPSTIRREQIKGDDSSSLFFDLLDEMHAKL
jgi:hypothetical protein